MPGFGTSMRGIPQSSHVDGVPPEVTRMIEEWAEVATEISQVWMAFSRIGEDHPYASRITLAVELTEGSADPVHLASAWTIVLRAALKADVAILICDEHESRPAAGEVLAFSRRSARSEP
jgi:hypothetical protein